MDIEIKYHNGSMVVHLEQFLDCRSISKVRKLVKLIHNSSTPNALGKMKEFIEQQLEQFEPRMKEDANYIVGYKPKLKFNQEQLDKSIGIRSRFKQNSESWKKYNEQVKQYRQEVSHTKTLLRNRNSDFDKCIRNKAFYEKVLEIIS